MGYSTVRGIVLQVCEALWRNLQPYYLPEEHCDSWLDHAQRFNDLWQFPHCVGALDGKHIQCACPPRSGSLFFNYKGHFSIVLLAIASADYRFTMIDVGAFGSPNDPSELNNSEFGRRLEDGDLDLPMPEALDDCEDDTPMPYTFVADSIFKQRPEVMKPYPGRRNELTDESKVYNYRHKRARMVVENTFGILAARFRIFHRKIFLTPDHAVTVVRAACVLHNYLVKPRHVELVHLGANGQVINPPGWDDLYKTTGNRTANEGIRIRDLFRRYFNNEGAVPWQRQGARLDF